MKRLRQVDQTNWPASADGPGAAGPRLRPVSRASVATGRRRDGSRSRRTRGWLGSGVFLGGLAVYALVQDSVAPRMTFQTPWDARIPFVPEMIFAYLLFFPYVVVAAFAAERSRFLTIVVAALLACLVGWTCFLVFPASLTRPDPASVGSPLLRTLFTYLHAIDDSHNTFPSLHVAVTWIAVFSFQGTRTFWPGLVLAALISCSTLLVKQHTLVDVGGGMVIAFSALIAAASITARAIGLRSAPDRSISG